MFWEIPRLKKQTNHHVTQYPSLPSIKTLQTKYDSTYHDLSTYINLNIVLEHNAVRPQIYSCEKLPWM